MRRNLLGIIALGLIVSGAIGTMFGYQDDSTAGMAAGVGMRVGLMLGALWIAYPQLAKMVAHVPIWLLGMVAFGAMVVVINPRSFIPVAVAVSALVALQFAGRFLTPPSKNVARRQRKK